MAAIGRCRSLTTVRARQNVGWADTGGDRSPARGPRGPRPGGRAIWYLVTAWVLVTLNFFLPRAMPGDPLDALQAMGSPNYVEHDATRAALARYYDLDRPILAQYKEYLAGLARGDLGMSILENVPVSRLLWSRAPWTLLLVSATIALSTAAGIVIGIHSGWRRGSAADRRIVAVVSALHSFPVFFVASVALFVFAVKLRWFPLAGATTPFTSFGALRRAADIARHLALPCLVLALQFTGYQYLTMRASVVSELGADYMLLGRAKGVSERRLKYGYVARNAMLTPVTVLGLQVGVAISAGIFVERLFAYPGIGNLMFEAIAVRDYPTIQGCFLVMSLVVLSANLLADVAYHRLDPRTGR